jgi:hypothetical protein
MKFTEEMQKYFWLYWRLYDTHIAKDDIRGKFGANDKKLNKLLSMFRTLKLCDERDAEYELTMRGAFWIHLAQNFFSLHYIDKVWSAAMKEAYPSEIAL